MGLFGRKKKSTDHTAELIAEAQRSFTTDTTGFRLPVADVFEITGRGTVVTGTIEAGSVHKGAKVRLTRADGTSREVTVTGVEMFRKLLDSAGAGDNVGLLLDRSVKRADIARGDVLSG